MRRGEIVRFGGSEIEWEKHLVRIPPFGAQDIERIGDPGPIEVVPDGGLVIVTPVRS
jgi:hypothetical protein